ncbi:glycosyltransferase family 4 protein [Winogradskyella tangerina]|uniref:glycosyltransferase family 4 protein n=1 Tax=Winogradskyella tangerina TaxID=2023240 RepID=UPI000DBE70F5|nr:glycosyltransferase family 4 protein [Winogradskyella tangerina]
MKNVLYVGNALSKKGKTITSIETLGAQLAEFCTVKIVSNKSNKILRLLDMIAAVLIGRNRYDFVLIDTYSTTNFYYALVISQLCRLFKIKYIPILHGGNLETRLKNNPKLSAKIFKNAHKLVSPSIFLQKTFENYGFNSVEFIPNTINIENFTFQKRDGDTTDLLWVRSFSKIYNPEMAVHVLEGLLAKGIDAKLTMVGPDSDGSLQRVKSQAKEKGLQIKFTGKLSRQEWVELSKTCNIFINTTNYDNMPVSVIEAMALGLPIVSTNVGGIPFLIEDETDGLLVPANNVEAMITAIINLKNNLKLKDQLIANARKKVENFDWKIVKPMWESLLA